MIKAVCVCFRGHRVERECLFVFGRAAILNLDPYQCKSPYKGPHFSVLLFLLLASFNLS